MFKSAICKRCDKEFEFDAEYFKALGYQNEPKKCQACRDRENGRPSITLSTKELFGEVVNLGFSPNWVEFDQRNQAPQWKNDRPSRRWTVKGSQFGASWSGRIELWAVAFGDRTPQKGDIVRFFIMESNKECGFHRTERATMKHGTIPIRRRCHIADARAGINAGDESYYIAEESNVYMRLLPCEPCETAYKLVYETAHTKTTLKGYGRQYHSKFDVEQCVWSKTIQGGVRSGRAYTVGCLAIVSDAQPLIKVFKEGGEAEETIIQA
jgi:hypothetical protein